MVSFIKILLDNKSKKFMKKIYGLRNSVLLLQFVGKLYLTKNHESIDKNIAEFYFESLHNMLPNKLHLSKWNKNIEKYCPFCQEIKKNTCQNI